MANNTFDRFWEEGVVIEAAPREILDMEGSPPLSRAMPSGEDDTYLQACANEQLNSRLTSELDAEIWEVRWSSELFFPSTPNTVLTDGRRILVQGKYEWQLFHMSGEFLLVKGFGNSSLVLDPANKLFYGQDDIGYLVAYHLGTGEPAFFIKIAFGGQYSRPFLARRGQYMVVIGVEKQVQPEVDPPTDSIIEVLDLGSSIKVRDDEFLESFQTRAEAMRGSILLLGAMHKDTLVLATEDYLYFADLDLKIDNVLSAAFIPIAMSLDEAMNIYLIVFTEENGYALWAVTPNGERFINVGIPEISSYEYAPPIVGYNHQVYVILEDHIISISSTGQLLWDQYVHESIAGAVVTANDQLLVSVGNMLMAFDENGERSVLHIFENEELMTQPILTKRGRIIIATQRKLYYLIPRS